MSVVYQAVENAVGQRGITDLLLMPARNRQLRREETTNHIVGWSSFDRGGHPPAMEEPDLLVEDLRTFVRRFR